MNPGKNNPDFLKVSEAAEFLGVSTRTIYNMMSEGKLPYSRPGGMYYIRRNDLDEMMTGKIDEGESSQRSKLMIPIQLNRCGSCSRIIKNLERAEFCAEEGCDRPICIVCQRQNINYCNLHTPDRSQQISEARKKFEVGGYPVFVDAISARMLEIKYLSRIEMRIDKIQAMIHPETNEVVNIRDWDMYSEFQDNRGELMSLLGKVVLDQDALAGYPLNMSLLYQIPMTKLMKRGDVEISVHVISRMDVMVQQGFDVKPLSENDLSKWLVDLSVASKKEQPFKIIVLASVTGWDQAAVEAVDANNGTGLGGFIHKKSMLYLFDLQKGILVYNRYDERARRYAELFSPKLPKQEVDEAVNDIDTLFVLRDSLTLKDASLALPVYSLDRLQAAFQQLSETGRYTLIEIVELGLTLVRK